MRDPPELNSASRARWLAQLAEALGEAERLTNVIATWRPDAAEAVALRSTLRAVMAEVEALRLGVRQATEIKPFRTNRPRRVPHQRVRKDD